MSYSKVTKWPHFDGNANLEQVQITVAKEVLSYKIVWCFEDMAGSFSFVEDQYGEELHFKPRSVCQTWKMSTYNLLVDLKNVTRRLKF